MIGALITYAFIVSVLIAIAALGAEQLVGRLAWPKRVVWISSLLISVVFPLSIALMTQPVAASSAPLPMSIYQPGETHNIFRDSSGVAATAQYEPPIGAPIFSDVTTQAVRWRFPATASVLLLSWMCLSVGMVLFYFLAWVQLFRLVSRCTRVALDGVLVRRTEKLGPAVFGFLRPQILIPEWLLASAPATRSIALRHECEHIAARDPLMLLFAILCVALAPWNPSLWWQLGRLRFAIEADCDARALRGGANVEAYAEALLAVGAHRTLPRSHLMALTTRTSWLERRVRLMLSGAGSVSRLAAGSGAALAVGLIIATLFLQAPGLAASSELRKLPPQDTRPAATAAIAVAQSEFPELFNQVFEGTAVVAVLLNRDGSVQLARKHLFPPGQPPSDLDMALENKPLGIDPLEDFLDGGHEEPDYTIGPWLQSKNPGRLFIVYEVLKWQHDPTRGRERVKKALEAYDPGLLKSLGTQPSGEVTELTVFMNEDGTVNRERKRVVHVGESTTEDWEERFAAMGVPREQLGRRGYLSDLTEPTASLLSVDYAWPRRADDPADVAGFEAAWRESYAAHPPKQDDRNDAEITARYFSGIKEWGAQAVTETHGSQPALLTPWMLLGRDGQIWDTGLRHNELGRFQFGMNTLKEIEARYPGIRVDFGTGRSCLPVKGVPIICVWVSAGSPIQRKQDVDLRHRKDLLLTSTLIYDGSTDPMLRDTPIALHFSDATNLDIPVNVGFVPDKPWVQVTASPAGPDAVTLLVRTRGMLVGTVDDPASKEWTPVAVLRVSYGSVGQLELFETGLDAPRKVRLILRPQQLSLPQ